MFGKKLISENIVRFGKFLIVIKQSKIQKKFTKFENDDITIWAMLSKKEYVYVDN